MSAVAEVAKTAKTVEMFLLFRTATLPRLRMMVIPSAGNEEVDGKMIDFWEAKGYHHLGTCTEDPDSLSVVTNARTACCPGASLVPSDPDSGDFMCSECNRAVAVSRGDAYIACRTKIEVTKPDGTKELV